MQGFQYMFLLSYLVTMMHYETRVLNVKCMLKYAYMPGRKKNILVHVKFTIQNLNTL